MNTFNIHPDRHIDQLQETFVARMDQRPAPGDVCSPDGPETRSGRRL